MATILYLSNQLVQAVEAKSNSSFVVCQEQAPEGSIINGIITDEEVFLEWIRHFFVRNRLSRKECTLVINSTQINSRVLDLPKTSSTEVMKMIAKEFADVRTDKTIFTYHTLLEGDAHSRMQRLLAVAVEREFLLSYVQLFNQAGIEVVSIEPAISGFVRRFMHSPEVHKKNCIVQVLDGQEILSMLFIKGVYFYSQRNRVFSDDDEGLARQAGAVVDRLLQFATTQQVEDPIDTLLVCGQNQDGLKRAMEEAYGYTPQLMPRIYKEEKIRLKTKAESSERAEFLYASTGMLKADKHLNLVRQLRQDSKELRKKRERAIMLLPIIIVLVVCLLISAALGATYLVRSQELNQLQAAMEDKGAVSVHSVYELTDANIAGMEQRITEAGELWSHLMSYPTLSPQIRTILNECAGDQISLEIRNFSRDSGVISLDASAADVRVINEFIERLQEQSLFAAVEYSGYTIMTGQNRYSIHVICALAESAGR